MATTDWNLELPRAFDAGGDSAACQGKDLKALLNTIVEQLTDADRRHTGTLQQLQDRLSTMGGQATSIRARVPETFAPLFERIESSMAELAQRIAEATHGLPSTFHDAPQPVHFSQATAQPAPVATPAASAFQQEPPVALRSAAGAAAPRSRDANIDPFDIIESNFTGDETDPWDRDSADALTGLYAPSGPGFAPAKGSASEANAAGMVDYSWLEQRFGDISRRIEESLVDVRPDHAFFALGQRLESVEQQMTRVADTAATRTDVEGIRLIEAHISELVGHLESAQNQLARLEGIEAQLNEVSNRLDEVHQVALSSDGAPAAPVAAAIDDNDIRAVARAAVAEASATFAKLAPSKMSTADEMRPLVERILSESRAGDENTAALLDTLQQAMIRLLDRVDAMELTQQQAIEAQAAFATQAAEAAQAAQDDYARQQTLYAPAPRETRTYEYPEVTSALDDAVAAVANQKAPPAQIAEPFAVEPQPAGSAPRSPERIRQDFIADARRAKMRLAAQDSPDGMLIARPDTMPEQPAPRAGVRPTASAAPAANLTPKSGTAAARLAAQPTSAPRLVVMGLGAMTALAGLWYALDGGANGPAVAPKSSVTRSDAAPSSATKVLNAAGNTTAPAAEAVSPASADEAPANGSESLGLPEGTRGEIVPDAMVVGQTSVPMLGIAVDAEAPVTAAELERAKRRQTMAAMSTKLGHAAAELSANTYTPASLVPEDPSKSVVEKAETAVLKSGMSTASPLDMPPASVGPLSLRLAAANGDPSAQFDVGARLAEGKGVSPDYKEAARWYQRSADQGFAQSQYRLGTLYERGLGLKADHARAQSWYEKAANAGNVKAMHNLAVMSANQSGASPDYESAGRWFSEASERGLADSQFNLAVLHENGLGVEKDMKQAYKWLSIAARSGDAEAVKRRDILKGKLTAEDAAAAEKLIAGWRRHDVDKLTNDVRAAADAWKKNAKNGVSG